MIKKTTTATFKDGAYAGQYIWQDGVPLSVGEILQVTLNGQELTYKLVDKTTSLHILNAVQLVSTSYWFELTK